MFISPIKAIEEGWVTHPECKSVEDFKARTFVSPNALDFPLTRLFKINDDVPFFLSEHTKEMRGSQEILATGFQGQEELFWTLDPHSVYDGMSDFHVTVPDNVAALLIVRSSLNRNGLFITSGIYDAGFDGSCGFAIHNRSGRAFIAPGTRIGQLIFIESDNVGKYLGGYNTKINAHWSDPNATVVM